MKDYYSIIQSSRKFEQHVKYYWGYQYLLSRDVIVPELMKRNAFHSGNSVAEIGCGEAGVLEAFIERGAVNPLGTDIATFRLDLGRKIAEELDINLTLTEHDILFGEPREEWKSAYDLVLLRDVIEHLDDATLALRNIRKILKPGGWLYVTFPPYTSPYGGHQHLLQNSLGKLPYAHLLPKKWFWKIIESGKLEQDREEVQRLHHIRLSAKKFLEAVNDAGYIVAHEEYYLLRPVFKMKFGLPTIKLTPLKKFPLIKTIFSLEAAYLLQMK
jgi:SAM-dependent methyltransferase